MAGAIAQADAVQRFAGSAARIRATGELQWQHHVLERGKGRHEVK